jgi:hypothetical protein
MSRRALLAVLLGAAAIPADAHAGGDEICRVIDVDFVPVGGLQIVVWLEDESGNFVDTLFITELTGQRGLGNRPGRIDFNSAWRWPYGRRENTFPVWAHRHGESWPMLYFQNDNGSHLVDSNLSHPPGDSSVESFYCRPLHENDDEWDAQTCASLIFTDKGVMSETDRSLYPPRADLAYDQGTDDPSVLMFDELNPFDAVSQATPIGGVPFRVYWSAPDDLADGAYTLFMEVSKESDFNATYNPDSYPEPEGISYAQYGTPYRGQPSVVYRIPVQIGAAFEVTTTDSYVGYGDPDGLDGAIRPPDTTIDEDVPGSGAQRLLTITGDDDDAYRIRLETRTELDEVPPDPPDDGALVDVTATSATVSFYESGDDGLVGSARGYEIRYLAGVEMTPDNFLDGSPTPIFVRPEGPGMLQAFTIDNLLPQTNYWVGIRAYDDCLNYGDLTVVQVTTLERETGEVDACFVATAAYGSMMANDVAMLRDARDRILRSNVVGELLVEAYYTFGPALAGIVGESEELRGVAREMLEPAVEWLRDLTAWVGDEEE